MLESFLQDLRYALRGLRAKPAFALAVTVTLGLGIGANTAMFGVIDRLLLRPPPMLRDPETAHRIYTYETYRNNERPGGVGRFVRFRDLAQGTTSFSSMAGYTTRSLAVGVGDAAREMNIGVVSATFFGFFDAAPEAGRYFTDSEDQVPEGARVVVLSDAMWQTNYGGRKDAIGSAIQIGPATYTIIGVTPPGFVGIWADRPPSAYIPITTYGGIQNCAGRSQPWYETYSCGWMNVIARRKPSVSIAAANADLTQADIKSYQKQLIEQSGSTPLALAKPHAMAGSIMAERGPNPSPAAKVATWVAGVSVIVLLIACANVANLLLARALRRRREIALRLALGVRRWRLASQLLVESLVLAVLGGGAGLLIAHWGSMLLRAGTLEQSEAPAGLRDPRTMLFAGAAAIAVGLLAGLAPIVQSRSADLTSDLKAGVREGTHGRSRLRVGLLVFQGALSVLLLVGAGLFVRSLANVEGTRLGFDVDPIFVVGLNMRGEKLDSVHNVALKEQLLATARAVPGVEDATRQTGIPFWSMSSTDLYVQGIDTVGRLGQFDYSNVSPSYFKTFGTRVIRGRSIDETDRDGAPLVTVVSENMGKVLWPGRDPIGQCIRVGADTNPCVTVVGIAENIKEQSLRADSGFYYYRSIAQNRSQSGGMFVRVKGDAAAMREPLRKALQHEMPGASYVTVTPFTDIIGPQKRSWRLGATMFVAFGFLALVLASVGLYSVIAYNVTQRTHELGVRVALGAQARDIIQLVASEGLRVAAAGIGLGLLIAAWASKFAAPLLFDTSPRDPLIYSLVAVVLIAVALAASWIPARRASRVDPNIALRSD
ncbi:MAG TPA: ABC transporter permease [Gemmatimonadaceae bacterium]